MRHLVTLACLVVCVNGANVTSTLPFDTAHSKTRSISTEISSSRSPSPTKTARLSASVSRSMSSSSSLNVSSSSSITVSSSRSKSISSSNTASDDGPVWQCNGLPVAFQTSILLPIPRAIDSSTIVLREETIRSTGVTIEFNISSCHTFESLGILSGDNPQILANRTVNSWQDVETYVLDLPSSAQGLNDGEGFELISSRNPSFVSWISHSSKSVTLELSAQPQYSPSRQETLLMTFPREYFVPRPPKAIVITLLIAQSTQSEAKDAERGLAWSGAGFVTVLAMISRHPETALVPSRYASINSGRTCPRDVGDQRVDINLLGFVLGSDRNLRLLTGGMATHAGFLIAIAFFHYLIVLAAFGCFDAENPERILSKFAFPTGMFFPSCAFLFQGLMTSSVRVFFSSESVVFCLFAGSIASFLLVLPVVVLAVTNQVVFDRAVLRACAVHQGAPPSVMKNKLLGVGVWMNRSYDCWHFGMYGSLYSGYLPHRQWFLAIELSVSILLGILDAISVASALQCLLLEILQTALFWLYVVVVIGMHPHNTTSSFIFSIGNGVFALVSSLLLTVASILVVQNGNATSGSKSLVDTASWCVFIGIGVLLLQSIIEAIGYVVCFVQNDVRLAAARRWIEDSKQKSWIDGLYHDRLKRIEKILTTDDGIVDIQDAVRRRPEDPHNLTVNHFDDRGYKLLDDQNQITSESATKNDALASAEDDYFVSRTGKTKSQLLQTL